MKIYILTVLFLLVGMDIQARQNNDSAIKGRVLDVSGEAPIPGVNILIKGYAIGGVTDREGRFSIELPVNRAELVFSFIGYTSQTIEVDITRNSEITVLLEEDQVSLAAVEVLSTGFQELSAERATGSFTHLDKALINRRVSANILDRMEDLTPGLIFSRDRPDLDKGESVSIRGSSTLLSDRQPLIVVDNMAYDGPVENINPNDVESITVLKDAAAASIWGAKSGNGVIVITTKRGDFESPLRVNFTSNITSGKAFDPFYVPQMSISDFVEVEQRLFGQGYFDGFYQSYNQAKISPVVESLYQFKNGEITQSELDNRLDGFKSRDLRTELKENLYRPSLHQQYALNLSGGTKNYTYFLGLGYDHNKNTEISSSTERITLNARQSWKLMDKRFKFSLGTYLVHSGSTNGSPEFGGLEPYDLLRDERGEPLPVFRDYSNRFKQDMEATELLDWTYFPVNEFGKSRIDNSEIEFRINPEISFEILNGLSIQSNYQYWQSYAGNDRLNSADSYFARDLINVFSIVGEDGSVIRNVPLGGINDLSGTHSYSHTWRSQLNFDRTWDDVHQLTALAGFELKDFQSNSQSQRAYGVDEISGISKPVDYVNYYPQLHTGFFYQIPFGQNFSGSTDRFLSGFANAGYTYKNRYILTASARKDASNLYGVSTNERAVPLWSTGVGWIISEERWMDTELVSYLKLKASYGYNGNTNPAATAYTTAQYFDASSNRWVGQPWLSVLNPPNPELRWERIKIVNVGVEYELWKQRLSGSLEYYSKRGVDLFGVMPTYPSSGVSTVTKNYAETNAHGMDLSLNVRVLQGDLFWNSSLFYSSVKENVISYAQNPSPDQVAGYSSGLAGIGPAPVEGYPLYSIFSYPFPGLDPTTGDPMGILDGESSTDYAAIMDQTSVENLELAGSAIPTHFGAWRNTLGWNGFELSANISYRLGYYFKKESVEYDNLNKGEIGHSDYSLRWQNPGDEIVTSVPSDPLGIDPRRSAFDRISSRRVRKGDHIRLQDVRLAYTFDKNNFPGLPFQNIQLYSYIDNIGLIWKAAKDVIDPDFRNFQVPRTYSFGLSINF
ncbi:TonB-linked SusC/RagA family outer membrane protein [Algoriphagus sp. 4150]|uniref:SusC/RagA family TonB-linked outer membrane protein n=1 Tax=Algoriphagus sp. 4150 TaxID=2817756 RepID=UPI00285AC7AA|nr:SusC/RagA family TonB-linked outer membrane protein [Algoriphagus sp. 4150]MDR7131663.1 TonB-linked SusC/RagA family outer membrane protein [Algoriphagus sp. 4150]